MLRWSGVGEHNASRCECDRLVSSVCYIAAVDIDPESPKSPLEKIVYWGTVVITAVLLWLYIRK